jgi:4-amino-4-deoxychorismate lyase
MIDYFNGKFQQVAAKDFSQWAWQSGFFTTFKVVENTIIDLPLHLKRLTASLQSVELNLPQLPFQQIIRQLLEINGLSSARLKLMIYREQNRQNCWLQILPLQIDSSPRVLGIYPSPRVADPRYRHKSINYSPNIRLNQLAKKNGFDDYLFYDETGYVLETTFCNIFFVDQQQIVTPSQQLAILPGTVRKKIIELKKVKNIQILPQKIRITEIGNFESAFLTNAILGMVPIKQIGEIRYKQSSILQLLSLKIS